MNRQDEFDTELTSTPMPERKIEIAEAMVNSRTATMNPRKFAEANFRSNQFGVENCTKQRAPSISGTKDLDLDSITGQGFLKFSCVNENPTGTTDDSVTIPVDLHYLPAKAIRALARAKANWARAMSIAGSFEPRRSIARSRAF